MAKKYHNEHAECVHKTAAGFFRSGLITEKEMEEFNEMCLVQEKKETPARRDSPELEREAVIH